MKRLIRNLYFFLSIAIIAATLGCAGNQTQRSTGQYVDDAAITSKVKTALLRDPDVSGLDIQVETFRGQVQLSGFVNSEEQAEKAEQIAEQVSGVRSVQNSLLVK